MINLRVGGADAAPSDFDNHFFFAGFRVRNIFITEITFAVDNYCFQFFTSLYISFGLKITVNVHCTEMIICPARIN